MATIIPFDGIRARLPGSQRAGLLIGLGVMAALAWTYLFYQDWSMSQMDAAAMTEPATGVWGVQELSLLFAMWGVMMAAMMLPSVTPMMLLFAAVSRGRVENGPLEKNRAKEQPLLRTGIFVSGYLSVWTGFSLLATLGQWGLHAAVLLTEMMVTTSSLVGGMVLMAAGIYQWTPLKQVCLAHCRSPLAYLMTGWRSGAWGAFCMGFTHGAYCTGCCWLLMALLFVVGVMNLWWIIGLSVFVLVEKVLSKGVWLARGSGLLLIVWGGKMLLSAVL